MHWRLDQCDAKPLRVHALHPSDVCDQAKDLSETLGTRSCNLKGVSLHIKQRDDVEIEKSGGREMRRGEKWRETDEG